jgi:hypothetical protein
MARFGRSRRSIVGQGERLRVVIGQVARVRLGCRPSATLRADYQAQLERVPSVVCQHRVRSRKIPTQGQKMALNGAPAPAPGTRTRVRGVGIP